MHYLKSIFLSMKMSLLNSKFILVVIFTILNTLNSISFSQTSPTNNKWEQKADTVIAYAKSQLGVPYVWATSKPGVSFDCSGFTYYAYNNSGVKSYRGSSAYKSLGYKVPLKSCRKGDCILFTGTQPNDKSIGHVGIILKNEDDILILLF